MKVLLDKKAELQFFGHQKKPESIIPDPFGDKSIDVFYGSNGPNKYLQLSSVFQKIPVDKNRTEYNLWFYVYKEKDRELAEFLAEYADLKTKGGEEMGYFTVINFSHTVVTRKLNAAGWVTVFFPPAGLVVAIQGVNQDYSDKKRRTIFVATAAIFKIRDHGDKLQCVATVPTKLGRSDKHNYYIGFNQEYGGGFVVLPRPVK